MWVMASEQAVAERTPPERECCCSAYHHAIELIGKRWTGAIVFVLLDGPPKRHLHEEAREAGWEDEQILEAVAHVALATFGNLVTRAGDVPIDGSTEDSRLAQAA